MPNLNTLPILKTDEGKLIYDALFNYINKTTDEKEQKVRKKIYEKFYSYAFYNDYLCEDDFIDKNECFIIINAINDFTNNKDSIIRLIGHEAKNLVNKYIETFDYCKNWWKEIWEIRKLKEDSNYLNFEDMVDRFSENWKGNLTKEEKKANIKDYKIELNESKKNRLPTDTIKILLQNLTEDAESGDYWAKCVKNNIEKQINGKERG